MGFPPKARQTLMQAGAALTVLCGLFGASSAGASPMMTGGLTSQPIGHYEFCKANPEECIDSSGG